MSEDYVVATQQTIGTLITKPKMADKYLKKPPFRSEFQWRSLGTANCVARYQPLSPELKSVYKSVMPALTFRCTATAAGFCMTLSWRSRGPPALHKGCTIRRKAMQNSSKKRAPSLISSIRPSARHALPSARQ